MIKHDLNIDFYYVMTYFLFWKVHLPNPVIAGSKQLFWVFLNKEIRYKEKFDSFRVLMM